MVEVYQSQFCHVMVMFQYVGIGRERPFHNAERISRVRLTIELHGASIASNNATSSFKVGNTALTVSDNVYFIIFLFTKKFKTVFYSFVSATTFGSNLHSIAIAVS